MSESLKRLRELTEKEKYRREHPTPAQKLARHRFALAAREVTGIKGVVEYKGREMPASAAKVGKLLGGVNELERKAEEARKEEERLKNQWKDIKRETLTKLINFSPRLRRQLFEENNAYNVYMKLAKEAPIVPTYPRTLEELAMQEKKHEDILKEMLRDLETKIKALQRELQ